MVRITAAALVLAGLVGWVAETSVLAQGRGRTGPPSTPRGRSGGGTTQPAPGGGSATNAPVPKAPVPNIPAPNAPAPISRPLSFGAWLDDAETLPPGAASASIYLLSWHSGDLKELEVPVLQTAMGVAPHVQLGATLPYERLSDRSGFSMTGRGDTYVTAKIGVVDASTRAGVAIIPTLEILSDARRDLGFSRFNWVLPVSVQGTSGRVRMYGTGGYFSRGALFGGGALEVSAGPRVTAVGMLTHSYSTGSDRGRVSDISRHYTEIAGGAYITATPTLTLFVDIGRSLSRLDSSEPATTASIGLTINFGAPTSPSPGRR